MASKPPHGQFPLGPPGQKGSPGFAPPGLPGMPGRPNLSGTPYGNLGAAPQMHAGLPRGIVKHEKALRTAAAQNGISLSELNAFMTFWAENELKFAQKILDFKDAPENAIEIMKMFNFFRKLGVNAQQMAPAFVLIAGLRSPVALSIMHHVVIKGPELAAKLKPLGNGLKALGLFIAAVEVYNLVAGNEWSQAVAKIYKTVIGLAVPWGGAIDALQSFLPEVGPKTAIMLKVVRACDPVGLGGAGVDSFIWMVQSIVDKIGGKPFDEERLNKLATRLKTGPTSFFYEIGEKIPIGDLIFDISEMSIADWKALGMKPVHELHDYLRSWRR